jgi:hypothetical protein
MIKPSKTFKISKQTKRLMATVVNTVQRGELKSMMIQAQLLAQMPAPREKSEKK